MDAKYIGPLFFSAWLLLTLGIYGATGLLWWIWPLSAGVALLLYGAGILWALREHARDEAAKARTVPKEIRT